jgi:hypothetical protein
VVGVLAVSVALANSALIDRIRRILPHLNRISGVVLIVVGLYVGYYGLYEIRLFSAGGSAQDPVINAAGRIQRHLSGWVYEHGVWPWVLAVGLLALAVAVVWARRRRRRSAVPRSA